MIDALPQLIQLAREAADQFNEQLQIIIMETHMLSKQTDQEDLHRRILLIRQAADRAASLSRQLFGLNGTRGGKY